MSADGPVRIAVLIAAAGAGRRVGAAGNKLLLPLAGEPLIVRTVRAFQAMPAVERIALVVRPEDQAALERCFAPGAARERLTPWVAGGAERQDSVYNGLVALAPDPPDRVLVHDGARPFCSAALVGRVLGALADAPGAVPVLPVTDTVRRIVEGQSEVVPRDGLFRAQTPQGFHWAALWEAHRVARERGFRATDDAQLLEEAGQRLAFVEGDAENVKLTTREDWRWAEWRLGQTSIEPREAAGHGSPGNERTRGPRALRRGPR